LLVNNHTDETLVMLTLAGDPSAFEELVVRYQNAVIASAMQFTHSRFMAEDAAQDAFVTAWMKLDTLRLPDRFGAWVCRIACNCARNMVTRYRSFIDFDLVENTEADDPRTNPAELYALSEERTEVHKSLGVLPEKVGRIIRMHYFDGLSIAEIADRMRISEGTVKRQLHDGRKRIRKELCAMNETYCDTLVQRVMKKVEELKLWQLKNDKGGFAAVYRDVLREVEDLPESDSKYYALADVLMRGWWWLPGDKNDALFAQIRAAAIRGKNDDVMEFITSREDSQVWGSAKIEFIRDKQIPQLEQAGLVRTLAREWFWLGHQYFECGEPENGYAAFDRVQALLTPADRYWALALYAKDVQNKMDAGYRAKSHKRYLNNNAADELRIINGHLRYWKSEQYGEGWMNSIDREAANMLFNVSRCDGWFFDGSMAVGDTKTATDGTTLTFAADEETVQTPAGVFEHCQVWITRCLAEYSGFCENRVWYCGGVGIVQYARTVDDLTEVRQLKHYNVRGDGLLPFVSGNTWEYADTYPSDALVTELVFRVTHADEERVIVASRDFCERLRYDEDSWLDMIQQIRNEYWIDENGCGKLGDISVPLKRVEALAGTPMEMAHTKAALSVVRRIIMGETPNSGYTGHWNFFAKYVVYEKDGRVKFTQNGRWSFELKCIDGNDGPDTPLLYNDIYGILQDAVNCIWSDEWDIGASPTVEYDRFGEPIRTHIVCEDGGTVTTKAGTFEGCLRLVLDIEGMEDGWAYRGGRKVYYFADGIGIVRTENEYSQGARCAVYELSAYEGTANGYMPMAGGLVRRYDAIGLTDGYIGSVEYTYVTDAHGHTVIFKDAAGIRRVPDTVTQYSSICGEVREEALFSEGKWQEGHLRHAVNNFRLMQHYLYRDAHHFNNSCRSAEICRFNRGLMESFGTEGTLPPAWYGIYG